MRGQQPCASVFKMVDPTSFVLVHTVSSSQSTTSKQKQNIKGFYSMEQRIDWYVHETFCCNIVIAWIKKGKKRVFFSETRPCALGHIWRHIICCVGSVWPLDCISSINFRVCFIAVSQFQHNPPPPKKNQCHP